LIPARIIAFLAASILTMPAWCSATQLGAFDVKVLTSLTETYDDNVAYTSTNEKDDFITRARIGLSALYEAKTESLELRGNIIHHKYADYDNYDNTSEDLSVTAHKEFSAYDRAIFSDTFTHAEEPSSFEDEFGRTSGRYSYNRNRLNIAYSREFSKEFTLIARYLNDFDTYSRSDLSDSMQNRIGFEGDYMISSDTTVYGMYDFYHRDFDPGSSATINSFSAGGRQYLTDHTFADAGLGYDLIHSFNNKDYIKPHFSASLTDDFDETTRLSASYDKRYYTNASTQDLFDYWRASLAFNKRLLQRLGFNTSVFYGKGRYTTFDIKDTLKGAAAGLSYDVSDNVTAGLNYSYSKTTSNYASRAYERNTISVSITAAF